MKFIEVSKSKSLQIDTPVFTKNDKGEYGYGKLIKQEKTAAGTVHTFEVATFAGDQPPAVKATLVANIVAICVPGIEPKHKVKKETPGS